MAGWAWLKSVQYNILRIREKSTSLISHSRYHGKCHYGDVIDLAVRSYRDRTTLGRLFDICTSESRRQVWHTSQMRCGMQAQKGYDTVMHYTGMMMNDRYHGDRELCVMCTVPMLLMTITVWCGRTVILSSSKETHIHPRMLLILSLAIDE